MYSPIYGPPKPNALSECAARHLAAMRRELAAGRVRSAQVFARFAADTQLEAARVLSCETAMKLAYLQCWARLERQALAVERAVAVMLALYGTRRQMERLIGQLRREA